MTHSPKRYARALFEALDGKTGNDRKKLLKHFLFVLSRRGDSQKLTRILVELERVYLAKAKAKKVEVESADPISRNARENIAKTLGGKVFFAERVRPELLAGIKILVNGELLIDASASSLIRKMFPQRRAGTAQSARRV